MSTSKKLPITGNRLNVRRGPILPFFLSPMRNHYHLATTFIAHICHLHIRKMYQISNALTKTSIVIQYSKDIRQCKCQFSGKKRFGVIHMSRRQVLGTVNWLKYYVFSCVFSFTNVSCPPNNVFSEDVVLADFQNIHCCQTIACKQM